MNRQNTTHRTNALTTSEAALDSLLQEAAAREWPGPNRNPRIEEFLMNEVSTKQRSRRRLGLFLGLGALMATSAVFGAARLYDRYTVRVEWNGQVYEGIADVALDGTASMDLTLDGCDGTFYIQPVGEDGQVNVTVECDPSGEACNLGTQGGADGEVTIECSPCPPEGCEKSGEGDTKTE